MQWPLWIYWTENICAMMGEVGKVRESVVRGQGSEGGRQKKNQKLKGKKQNHKSKFKKFRHGFTRIRRR